MTEQKQPWWQRLERGQAMLEYWPTIPVGVMVMIVAGGLAEPVRGIFQQTANGLTCAGTEIVEEVGSAGVDLEGGHRIEITSVVYDEETDRTTISIHVSSGDQPSISHWVLGIDEETADRIISSSEAYQDWGLDPTTGKTGIKFDIGYEGGSGSDDSGPPVGKGPKKGRVFHAPYSFSYEQFVEERDIVLTLTGDTSWMSWAEVTIKAGANQVSSGEVTFPVATINSGADENCAE